MIELVWDPAFIRIFKKWQKRHPNLIEAFQKKVSLFTQEPYHPSLRTHSLTGQLKDCWAISITYEYRLVLKFLPENKALLIDIGTHDEVYEFFTSSFHAENGTRKPNTNIQDRYMPIIYETKATVVQHGHLHLDLFDLPFEQGTQFLIKLIPQPPFDSADFKQRMRDLMRRCAAQNPFQGMSNIDILAELRRQREEMYGEPAENQL